MSVAFTFGGPDSIRGHPGFGTAKTMIVEEVGALLSGARAQGLAGAAAHGGFGGSSLALSLLSKTPLFTVQEEAAAASASTRDKARADQPEGRGGSDSEGSRLGTKRGPDSDGFLSAQSGDEGKFHVAVSGVSGDELGGVSDSEMRELALHNATPSSSPQKSAQVGDTHMSDAASIRRAAVLAEAGSLLGGDSSLLPKF